MCTGRRPGPAALAPSVNPAARLFSTMPSSGTKTAEPKSSKTLTNDETTMLNLITAITTFRPVPASVVVRIVMLIPTFAIGLWIALTASADFSTNVGIFLSFLLIAFVPWGAINLIDYYWVRHGDYDVAGFFNKRGVYYSDATSWTIAGVNYKALTAYAAGVLVCLPFVSNAVFQGPGAAWFGGADLSWIPGLLATGAVYLVLAKRSQPAELVVEEAR